MNQSSHIILDKELRRDIDVIIQRLKRDKGDAQSESPPEYMTSDQFAEMQQPVRHSRERSLAVTKLQEAVVWLGLDLKAINDESGGTENPYPNSKDPSNTTIEPAADGLKL